MSTHKKTMMRRIAQLMAVGAALASATEAMAAYGVVRGNIEHWNKLSLSCTPSTANGNCVGARYLDSQFDRYEPIRNAVVKLFDASTREVIGEGFTNAQGQFTVPWFRTVHPGNVYLEWHTIHRDNRFRVTNDDGRFWSFHTNTFLADATTSMSAPQDIGPHRYGWRDGPNSVTNVYYAAQRVWSDALSSSALMHSRFTNERIRVGNFGGSSFARDDDIFIDNNNAFQFDTIAHELGHEASDEASRNYKFCGDYGRDGVPGHSLNSPEWQCASFEEGVATFIGSRALYWQTARQPMMYGWNLENPNNYVCSGTQNRWEVMTSAFLRDAYDTQVDRADEISMPFYRVFDVLNAFTGSTGNRGKDEPWRRFRRRLDDKDGRSAVDYLRIGIDSLGLPSAQMSAIYAQNCSPVGD